MTKTNQQIANKALRELFITPVEQSARAGANAIVLEVLEEAYDELSGREIANWADDAAPDAVAGPLARYVAAMAASRISGVQEEQIKKLDRDKEYRNIVAVMGKKWRGEPTQVDRF